MIKKGIYKWFVSWYALPEEIKQALDITTETRFAQTSDISRKQLWVWKKKAKFQIDVRKEMRSLRIFDLGGLI
ncbi:MAG: hypothetical protein ACE5GL_01310 [Calditrichia bacterium]